MGNVASWLAQCFYPEDQIFWAAARHGDARLIRAATSRLTPETRSFLEWQEPYTGRTALLEAAAKGHRECARLLVEAGANCNAKDLKLNTPLHLACKRARPEVVRYLLHVPAVNPFEVNLHMKTPLDLARSRYTEEEDEPEPYAKCIEILEQKFCLYSGWLYEKTDNVLSLVSGISSLNSWTRRLCIVLERGEPDVLELALFSMRDGGVRPACPSSVLLYNVAAGIQPSSDPRWFSPKDFTFLLRGDQLSKCHYRASSALQNPVHFAAVDQASFDAWKNFFTHQQQQLLSRSQATSGFHGGFVEQVHTHRCTPSSQPTAFAQSVAAAPSRVAVEEDADLRRAIELSLKTAAQASHDVADSTLSPPLPVSAPDWDDSEMCAPAAPAVHGAATVTNSSESEMSSSTEQKPPAVTSSESAPAYSSIGECVICFDGPQSAVCVPCGHNAVCMKCAEEILSTTAECPVCRAHIRELIKLYRV